MTPGEQAEQALRAAALSQEIARLANMLAGLDYRVHMAAARLDFEDMCDGAQQLLNMHVDFAELYRKFLAARMRGHSAEAAKVVMPLTADNRMSV